MTTPAENITKGSIEANNASTPCDNGQRISDDEIVADLFRLARSGRYLKAEPLLAAGASLYPNEPQERIKKCLRLLAERLWDTDHGGYATDYRLQRRHPRSSHAACA
ncbi:TPA: hypothetical protein L4R50_000040 [Pseudomonas aeruginosa]|nr:hypothetical protein [Pseudomonas aeruginosa]